MINKTDLADADELKQVHAWLDRIAADVPRFETRDARVPSALRDGPSIDVARQHDQHDHAGGHDHSHGEQFETWLARPASPMSSQALRSALRSMPSGVLRMKGFVRIEDGEWAELQFAGRQGTLRRLQLSPVNEPVLIAIGLNGLLPRAALDALIAGAANGS